MDTIYDILIKEHGQVLDLFEEAIRDGSKKTFLKIKAELDPHLQGEETIFYPVLNEKEEARESVLEGYEEHRIAEKLLLELKDMDEKEERWNAKIKVLQESIKHHVHEEQNEIFEISRKVLSQEKAEEIAQKYIEFKKDFKGKKNK
jgi:iron-sulfur cluster repair protein YtfE (RIC family)